MSVQEFYSKEVLIPEKEIPEFKAPASVLNKWERFKRHFDQKWRPSSVYALVINIILLVSVLALIWVCVAYGGFILNPPTMLGLFGLPILFAIYDGLRLMEQEVEKNKEKEINLK